METKTKKAIISSLTLCKCLCFAILQTIATRAQDKDKTCSVKILSTKEALANHDRAGIETKKAIIISLTMCKCLRFAILQTIVTRAQDKARSVKTFSTEEFRHFANKDGNLDRPFLKDFFPRLVGSHRCSVLRMGFSYIKRKNVAELAVLRGRTTFQTSNATILDILSIKYFSIGHKKTFSIVRAIDWRMEGAMTPVKNQGYACTCTIFATVAAVESLLFIKGRVENLTPLSVQSVINWFTTYNCDDDETLEDLVAGNMEDILKFIQHEGILSDEALPYEGLHSANFLLGGPAIPTSPKFNIDGYIEVPKIYDKEVKSEMIQKIVFTQPVIADVDSSQWDDASMREDMVYSGPWKKLDHAVVIAGYGKQNGKKFWLVRNSYGPEFGQGGYIKIERGVNAYGIEEHVCYPTLKVC